MTDHEVHIDDALVAQLIEVQFPEYRGLALERAESAGTDHAMYRLGAELAVRLPRFRRVESQVHKEHDLLPTLASDLPLAIPAPVGLGLPGDGFDMHWSIYQWLDGANAFDEPITDMHHAAVTLGQFGATLRQIDATNGPASFRGEPLAAQEVDVLAAIDGLGKAQIVDHEAALDAWQRIIRLPQWSQAGVWTHSDLLPGNLLARNGRVSAVIDWGCLGVGDPACDMLVAWTVLTASERDAFRDHAQVDDATWERGRGWAFGFGLMAYHYHHVTNPVLAAVGRRSLSEVMPELTG